MEDIGKYFSEPIRKNVPNDICPECVFHEQVELIADIVENKIPTPLPTGPTPEHVLFV